MKYSIIKCINGAFSVDSQHGELTLAKVRFHAICQTLWNSADVKTAKIMIVDEQLNCVEDYREYIHHDSEPEPEPETVTAE
jgi:hypothetical protein